MPDDDDELKLDWSKPIDVQVEADPIINKHIDAAIGETGATQGDTTNAGTDNKQAKQEGGDKQAAAAKAGDSKSANDLTKPAPVKAGEENKGKVGIAGDLTLRDGTVIKAGPERRWFEQAQIAKQQLADKNNHANQVQQNYERLKEQHSQLQSTVQNLHGADPQQVSIGLNIVRDLQRDPVGTMRKLLTEVISQGYTIEGIAMGIDKEVINRLTAMQPNAQVQQGPTEEEINTEVAQEVNQFFSRYPDARPHETTIVKIMRDHPQLSLSEAYFELRTAYANRGYDFSVPLEQIAALEAQTAQQPNAQQQQAGPGMVNGRPQVPASKAAGETVIAHESTDMGDIVKAAMRESGLNI